MEYESFDSSGTDDDLPPPHKNRLPRGGGRFTGNGRSAIVGSMPSYPRMYAENDMEAQIHQLEREAYSSVLRAFKAQADAITWEKESVITELRKELRLSNEEHKELLSQVNADEAIRKIREWRQGNGVQQGISSSGQGFQDLMPSPSVSASRKKQKPSQPVPSQSHGGPPPPVHQQAVNVPHHPFLSSAKRGSVPGSNKGKKHSSGKVLPSASSMKPNQSQYPPVATNGRGSIDRKSGGALASEPTEKASVDPLIGKKVRTRWPEDNHFYEAFIQDYNPVEGLHALVYDKGTPTETWEWVNLAEISPEDIQWTGGEPAIFQRGSQGASGHVKNRPAAGPARDNISGPGKVVPKSSKPKFKKEHFPMQNGSGKKIPVPDIRLRRTDTLIEEVERFFTSNRADPREIEEAKKMLKEHEDALVDAISRLGDISDGDHDGRGDRFQRGRLPDR